MLWCGVLENVPILNVKMKPITWHASLNFKRDEGDVVE